MACTYYNALRGIKVVFLQAIDQATQLPIEDSEICRVQCAEGASMEPQVEEGEETTLICDGKVIADALDEDAIYGWNITLTNNTFDDCVQELVSGMVPVYETDAEGNPTEVVKRWDSPRLCDDNKFRPFRMFIFIAVYNGSTIVSHFVVIFNFCVGSSQTMDFTGTDFFSPEFTIKAREAVLADRPTMSYAYYYSGITPTEIPEEILNIYDDVDEGTGEPDPEP